MIRVKTRRVILAFVAVTALAATAGMTPHATAGAGGTPTFTTPVALTGATGGEPGIATDRAGNVYVVGPQGIPSGVGGTPGIGYWVSHDNGDTFANGTFLGSFLGG